MHQHLFPRYFLKQTLEHPLFRGSCPHHTEHWENLVLFPHCGSPQAAPALQDTMEESLKNPLGKQQEAKSQKNPLGKK